MRFVLFSKGVTELAIVASIVSSSLGFVLAGETGTRDPVVALKPPRVMRVHAEYLPNVIRVHPRVYSGGQPAGTAGFRELREMGIRTVICVDGAIPDVEAAKRFGLKYVHLPHGYDGIQPETAAELARAVSALPGPVYIHCHHGKNRSPAAAAVACVGAGFLDADEAVDVLTLAGTSERYRGLYQSARAAHPIAPEKLSRIPTNFPEIATIPAMAEAMVEISHSFERMKAVQAANWEVPPDHPDVDPAHEALLLRERFTELLRTDDVQQRSAAFRAFLKESEQAGFALEKALRAEPKSADRAARAFGVIATNCKACHARFRDLPLAQ